MLVKGYALNCTVASQGYLLHFSPKCLKLKQKQSNINCLEMPKKITNPKIAFLDMNLQAVKMSLGVHVNITDPNKLEEVKKRLILLP